MAHGIGQPKNNKQAYEAEIFNINNEVLVFDTIDKMRSFIDSMNILFVDTGRMLGHTLPFVILEIQSTGSDSMLSEWITEEWYVYSRRDKMYVNIGYTDNVDTIIDIYNELNEEYI